MLLGVTVLATIGAQTRPTRTKTTKLDRRMQMTTTQAACAMAYDMA
jgi:hypothetical protein